MGLLKFFGKEFVERFGSSLEMFSFETKATVNCNNHLQRSTVKHLLNASTFLSR